MSTTIPINKDPHHISLPIPPLPVLTRSTNPEMEDYAPSTPTSSRFMDFITPQQTPQGSPSKNNQPPGAFDLPNAFDNALRLFPSANTSNVTATVPPLSPTKQLPPSRLPQFSPAKVGIGAYDASSSSSSSALNPVVTQPTSPTRNKENTPPTGIPRSPKKEQSAFISQAAQSRAGHYRTRDAAELAPPRPTYVQRGLSSEDLEKLKKPAVKRMANVTQLCMYSCMLI
jgi:cell cycle protein kinase DBF2